MRRIIIEVSERESDKLGVELEDIRQIKSQELLYFLRQDQAEFAAIWKVKFKESVSVIEAKQILENGYSADVQVLEQEKDGSYTVFIGGGRPIPSLLLKAAGISEGYLFPPLEILDGQVKISFVGTEQQISDFLKKLDEKEICYKIVHMTHADFAPSSPLNQLTVKQRDAMIAGFKFGYYDSPRKISTEELAKKLNMASSTLNEHLRKAEKRLLTELLNEK
jgi:hypothetical protein